MRGWTHGSSGARRSSSRSTRSSTGAVRVRFCSRARRDREDDALARGGRACTGPRSLRPRLRTCTSGVGDGVRSARRPPCRDRSRHPRHPPGTTASRSRRCALPARGGTTARRERPRARSRRSAPGARVRWKGDRRDRRHAVARRLLERGAHVRRTSPRSSRRRAAGRAPNRRGGRRRTSRARHGTPRSRGERPRPRTLEPRRSRPGRPRPTRSRSPPPGAASARDPVGRQPTLRNRAGSDTGRRSTGAFADEPRGRGGGSFSRGSTLQRATRSSSPRSRPHPPLTSSSKPLGRRIMDAARAREPRRCRRRRPGRRAVAHPLYAAAVVEQANPKRRSEIHGRLADLAATTELRAHHLAASIDEPAEDVAGEIEKGALDALEAWRPRDRRGARRACQRADAECHGSCEAPRPPSRTVPAGSGRLRPRTRCPCGAGGFDAAGTSTSRDPVQARTHAEELRGGGRALRTCAGASRRHHARRRDRSRPRNVAVRVGQRRARAGRSGSSGRARSRRPAISSPHGALARPSR